MNAHRNRFSCASRIRCRFRLVDCIFFFSFLLVFFINPLSFVVTCEHFCVAVNSLFFRFPFLRMCACICIAFIYSWCTIIQSRALNRCCSSSYFFLILQKWMQQRNKLLCGFAWICQYRSLFLNRNRCGVFCFHAFCVRIGRGIVRLRHKWTSKNYFLFHRLLSVLIKWFEKDASNKFESSKKEREKGTERMSEKCLSNKQTRLLVYQSARLIFSNGNQLHISIALTSSCFQSKEFYHAAKIPSFIDIHIYIYSHGYWTIWAKCTFINDHPQYTHMCASQFRKYSKMKIYLFGNSFSIFSPRWVTHAYFISCVLSRLGSIANNSS